MAEQAATVYRDFSQAMNLESGTFSNLPTSISISTFLGSRTLPVARRMAYLLNELHGSAPVAEIPYLGHMGIFLSPEKVNPLLANVISKH